MSICLAKSSVEGIAKLPKDMQRYVHREAYSLFRHDRKFLYLLPAIMTFVGGFLGAFGSVYFFKEYFSGFPSGEHGGGGVFFSWPFFYFGCISLGAFVFGSFGSLIRLQFVSTYLWRALEICIGRVQQTSNKTVESNRRSAP